MPLDRDSVIEQARFLLDTQRAERDKLDKVRRYWKGKQNLPLVIASGAPREVRTMAEIARVNVSDVIVESLTHSLFVEGLRGERQDENVPAWDVWQTNRFDRGQIGVHRAAVAYGTAYVVATPGSFRDSDVPLLRGCSPRRLTAVYGEDPDWPVLALEAWGKQTYRLYDEEAVYYLSISDVSSNDVELLDTQLHNSGVCPVVRFRDAEDLDAEDDIDEAKEEIILGQVAPMMNLQDQINLTSFNLLIAQHYAAFRQRWIIGWTAEDENQKLAAAASRLWTFDDLPENVKVGEFGQTDLKGYIDSRETAIKYMATISQTPVHELIGELVNLSAEALAAAEAGKDRKVEERKTGFGESWEQVFQLVGDVPDNAEVRWRDTSARSFAATVDALGKLASLLGIPPRGLWERIPGITDGDITRWEGLAEQGDSFARLETLLQGQATEPEGQPA